MSLWNGILVSESKGILDFNSFLPDELPFATAVNYAPVSEGTDIIICQALSTANKCCPEAKRHLPKSNKGELRGLMLATKEVKEENYR